MKNQIELTLIGVITFVGRLFLYIISEYDIEDIEMDKTYSKMKIAKNDINL